MNNTRLSIISVGCANIRRLRQSGIALMLLLPLVLPGIQMGIRSLLPDVERLRHENPPETALMRYREAQAAQIGKSSSRTWMWVPLDRISPDVKRAVLLAEDDKFYLHQGFDWEAIRGAFEQNMIEQRIHRGGSTITQQLAKNLYLRPTRDPWRKLQEAFIASELERRLTKDRIFEIYLNVIEWGTGIYGIEAAAQTYYQKSAAAIGPVEAIGLATVLASPRRCTPVDVSREWLNIKRQSLAERMLSRGYIGQETYQHVVTLYPVAPQPATATDNLASQPIAMESSEE